MTSKPKIIAMIPARLLLYPGTVQPETNDSDTEDAFADVAVRCADLGLAGMRERLLQATVHRVLASLFRSLAFPITGSVLKPLFAD